MLEKEEKVTQVQNATTYYHAKVSTSGVDDVLSLHGGFHSFLGVVVSGFIFTQSLETDS